ncbi:MAG: hypothetical protein ACREO2_10105 [Arenimonas sp.]
MQTRIYCGFLFLILICSQIALAAEPAKQQIPRPDEAQLLTYSPDNAAIETRLDADVTGDGLNDVVFVAASEDARVLIVMMGYVDQFNMGHEPIGQAALEPHPLGAASLTVKKGVLILEDLTGGTTAITALYRYRFDKAEHRMRLIGDDVSQYSRTNQHDAFEVSTNRLTGVSISKVSKLTDAGDYEDQPAVTKKVSAKPIYMEDTPNPFISLGCMDQ